MKQNKIKTFLAMTAIACLTACSSAPSSTSVSDVAMNTENIADSSLTMFQSDESTNENISSSAEKNSDSAKESEDSKKETGKSSEDTKEYSSENDNSSEETEESSEEPEASAEETDISEETKQNQQQTNPSADQTKPTEEQTQSSLEQTKPSAEQTQPTTEQSKPSAEQTQPSTEQTKPSAEQTQPSTEQTKPSAEQTEATTEEAQTNNPGNSDSPTVGQNQEYASAQAFVNSMGMGWNLGNTLDPVNCSWVSNELDYETAWGNPKTTRELISFIKNEGFDTIRIPVTWANHIDGAPDYTIHEAWLERVAEVVDWCMEEDMYVILNMHHEGDWLTKASTSYDETMKKYTAIWSQIADRFGNYSNKLIFESMNEIGFDDLGTDKGCALVNKINAEFTSLIRNSGKNNKNRYLLLAGYWTDIDRSCQGIILPADDKVILSVHYYSPAQFAIAEAGTSWGYQETWGTQSDFDYLEGQMLKLKKNFIDKGIPVIMGEYGCIKKDKDPASRILYLSSVNKACITYGICPVFWDNGEEIDRKALKWRTEGLADALREGLK